MNKLRISKTEKQKENFRKISLNEIRRNRINLLITLFNHKEGQKQPPKVFYKKRCSEACKYIRKKTLGQVFSCKFCEISKSTFFTRTPPDDYYERSKFGSTELAYNVYLKRHTSFTFL